MKLDIEKLFGYSSITSNKNYTSCKMVITGYRTSCKKRYNLKNKHRQTCVMFYFCENPGAALDPLGGPQTPHLTKKYRSSYGLE